MLYYESKIETLRDLFGANDVVVKPEGIRINHRFYPVVDDVIVLLPPAQYTPYVRARLGGGSVGRGPEPDHIQESFGHEWTRYAELLPEHRAEFKQYFDLVRLEDMKGARVCDLGCGNGRWAALCRAHCREMVLVDFSDAIFAARRNLEHADSSLFFMGDLRGLPFRDDAFDFVYCLGVLHHLPVPCLDATRALRRLAPRLLVFLYYALDNRPAHYRWLLELVTAWRLRLCRLRRPRLRAWIARLGAWGIYRPLVGLGALLRPFGLSSAVPLHDFYAGKSLRRLEQDVYDRFFTAIEQRVTRSAIRQLTDTFADVVISNRPPYWHFLCVR